ncbi:hypothetical protein D9615_007088 [Tricholomella constricta]|uniref:MYND-type domain-containing protein n=1 Tax=Tricholomella constricta TaxID=117010 RepID=A0A8H5M2G6_9AGAR|nr:hypothetical protein D9615_007088 [Tricholomella constricta]
MPLLDLAISARSLSGNNDGGLTVTDEMKQILSQPGFISLAMGGQRLRNLYVDQSMSFQAMKLSHFGLCCYVGRIAEVRQQVEAGIAPDLEGTETPFKFGYATLVVAGAQRVEPTPVTNHLAVMTYLISCGIPLDVPDIVGYTALGHAVISDSLQVALARVLLQAGANVNHQNRYGEVPLLGAFQKNYVAAIDVLMEFGADLDVKEADGMSPGGSALKFGPQVTAAVQKWIGRRSGKEAPRLEKRCDACGKTDVPLKNCAKCQVARYCSVECQRTISISVSLVCNADAKTPGNAWGMHKKACKPFSSSTTVMLKPRYEYGRTVMPTQALANKFFGLSASTPATHYRSAHVPKGIASESKNLVVKVQVPFNPATNRPEAGAVGGLFIYTKKRDFVCRVLREDCPKEYDRVAEVIRTKGVGGSKAYFAAELRSKDEQVAEVPGVDFGRDPCGGGQVEVGQNTCLTPNKRQGYANVFHAWRKSSCKLRFLKILTILRS